MEDRSYAAYTNVGGEELNLTLEEARNQASIWEEKGYISYVGKPDDLEWVDAPEGRLAERIHDLIVDGGLNAYEVTEVLKEVLMYNGNVITNRNDDFLVSYIPQELVADGE